MGMKTDSGGSGNIIFFTPIETNQGTRWARRVSMDTEGAVPRDAKCGQVFELYYQGVEGFIQSMRIVDKGEFGEELEIRMKDNEGDQEFILQTGFNSQIGKAIICRLESIPEPTDPIQIDVFSMKGQGGKSRRCAVLLQNGDKLPNPYAKKKVGDEYVAEKPLPPPEEKKVRGGKVEYDFREQDDFLYDLCKEWSIKFGWAKDEDEFRVSSIVRADDAEQEHAGSSSDHPDLVDDGEDVPF
jgi:hypothetical protein